MKFTFENAKAQEKPIDLELKRYVWYSRETIMEDKTVKEKYSDLEYTADKLEEYLEQVLQLEAVALKDRLTNKVDRSVSGRVVRQQGVGPLHLPLSDVAVVAMDYSGHRGIATSIGHAPVAALADAPAGSRLAIAEALTNLVWAPIIRG
ncbi:MAG: hypothetical protein V8S95_07800 [Odoribacter sp.]